MVVRATRTVFPPEGNGQDSRKTIDTDQSIFSSWGTQCRTHDSHKTAAVEVVLYTNILITTDGSELAQKGVDHGLTLAKSLGSKATVITVAEPYPLHSPATIGSWTEAQQHHADAALNLAKEAAAKMGVTIEVVLASHTSPAEAIVKTAQDRGCNLIVIASHGRRGVSRLLLGSQTAEVVHLSKIPVLVVR